MILTTYNIKGGTGKTSISIQLAKALNLTYISNDKEGGACEVFDDNKSFLVTEDEYTKIPLEKDCIYDLGGFRTNQNIYEIIKGSDFVIVPTLISRGDIKGTIKMLEELHPDVAKVVWKFNRWHHHVDYRSFKNNKLKRKEGLNIPEGINNYGITKI